MGETNGEGINTNSRWRIFKILAGHNRYSYRHLKRGVKKFLLIFRKGVLELNRKVVTNGTFVTYLMLKI